MTRSVGSPRMKAKPPAVGGVRSSATPSPSLATKAATMANEMANEIASTVRTNDALEARAEFHRPPDRGNRQAERRSERRPWPGRFGPESRGDQLGHQECLHRAPAEHNLIVSQMALDIQRSQAQLPASVSVKAGARQGKATRPLRATSESAVDHADTPASPWRSRRQRRPVRRTWCSSQAGASASSASTSPLPGRSGSVTA